MRFPLTPFQLQCLSVIRNLVAGKPWLPPSYVMAHVRIESGWDPSIKGSDYAATGSVGLMQVTAPVVKDRGYDGMDQTDPGVSLSTGVAQLVWCRAYLMKAWNFQHSILYHPVCEAYNEGVGNVVRGRDDSRYWLKWSAAQMGYSFVDVK